MSLHYWKMQMTSPGVWQKPAMQCCMQQGEITDFSDIHKIDRIRGANAQKHVTFTSASSQNGFSKKFGEKILGLCPATTITKICVSMIKRMKQRAQSINIYVQQALQMGGKSFTHPETQCLNKNKKTQSKNE